MRILLDLNGNALAAGGGCRLHYLADRLRYSSVTSDYHTGIVLRNGESELDVVSVNLLGNVNCFGRINDCAGDVGEHFLKIHLVHPLINYLMISLFLRSALTVSVG